MTLVLEEGSLGFSKREKLKINWAAGWSNALMRFPAASVIPVQLAPVLYRLSCTKRSALLPNEL